MMKFVIHLNVNIQIIQVEAGLKPETSQVKFIPWEAGPYQVELTYDSAPIPGSPFNPTAYPPTDATKVNMTSNPSSNGLIFD